MAATRVNWTRLKEVVADAIDAPPDQREAVLLASCDNDAELVAEARKLLAAHDDSSDVVLHKNTDPWLGLGGPDVLSLNGQRIGRYTLIRILGEGAMSAVYLARQTNPDRPVAVKLLRTALPLVDARQRFRREAQALARLKHPNIAVIYEAGLHDSSDDRAIPFIAMEYVDGLPLDLYAAKNNLNARAKIELMIEVALAVQSAHQQAIIHRDLKPANVLVDSAGRPKVLDFGIARIAAVDSDRATWQTTAGLLLGTPGYMSPEQCAPHTDNVDIRSDVWSLGVMAYELLLGRLPIETRGQSLTDVLRRLETSEPAAPHTIDPSVRGDLETILMTAVCRDKARRYPTAQAFADDLRRYLDQRPIEARPPTTLYLLTKFAKRNKGTIAAASVAIAMLTAATIVSSIGFFRASVARDRAISAESATAVERDRAILAEQSTATERDRAVAAEKRSTDVSRFLLELLRSPDPSRDGRAVTVLERIKASEPLIGERFQESPAAEAEVRSAIGQTLFELGEYDLARKQFERSIELAQRIEGPLSRVTLRERSRLVEVVRWQYRPQEAKSLSDTLLADALSVLSREDPDVLPMLSSAAGIASELENDEEAIRLFKEVVELRRRVEGPTSDGTLTSMTNLSVVYSNLSMMTEAEALQREVIAGFEARYGPDSPNMIIPRFNLGQTLSWSGRVQEALPIFEHNFQAALIAFGPHHDHTLIAQRALADTLTSVARYDEAAQVVNNLIQASEESLGTAHELTLRAYNTRGMLMLSMKRPDDAIADFKRVLASIAPDQSTVRTRLATTRNLATTLSESDRGEEALQLLDQITPEDMAGDEPYGHASTITCRAMALYAVGRYEESAAFFRQAADGFAAIHATQETLGARRGIARCLIKMTEFEPAERELLDVVAATQQDADPRALNRATDLLVQLYTAWEKPEEAARWRATTQPTTTPATQPVP